MFTVSFADKVPGAAKANQEGGTDEQCAGLEEGGHWSAGLGGGSGGGGWSWVDLGAPHPPHQTLKSSPGRPPKPAAPPNLSCAATNTGKQSQGRGERGYQNLGCHHCRQNWDSSHLNKLQNKLNIS